VTYRIHSKLLLTKEPQRLCMPIRSPPVRDWPMQTLSLSASGCPKLSQAHMRCRCPHKTADHGMQGVRDHIASDHAIRLWSPMQRHRFRQARNTAAAAGGKESESHHDSNLPTTQPSYLPESNDPIMSKVGISHLVIAAELAQDLLSWVKYFCTLFFLYLRPCFMLRHIHTGCTHCAECDQNV
jgi:hypothetical protein